MHWGIDVSDDQHSGGALINWAVACEYLRSKGNGARPFVIVNDQSSHATTDIDGAKANGAGVAIYHYGDPKGDPTSQAAASLHFQLGVASDLENFGSLSAVGIATWINRFLQTVQFGKQPTLCYDDISVYTTEIRSGLDPWPRWLAAPSFGPTDPLPLSCVCQQLQPGPMPGVPGNVDFDVWRGTESEFNTFFKLSQPPGDDVQPYMVIQPLPEKDPVTGATNEAVVPSWFARCPVPNAVCQAFLVVRCGAVLAPGVPAVTELAPIACPPELVKLFWTPLA